MSNPAATPSVAVDLVGDGRWMSLVRCSFIPANIEKYLEGPTCRPEWPTFNFSYLPRNFANSWEDGSEARATS